MGDRELSIIQDNLNAYRSNFGDIRIEGNNKEGYYIFVPNDNNSGFREDYIQYCYNIDYLNGWLYGAVQANNKIMKSVREEN